VPTPSYWLTPFADAGDPWVAPTEGGAFRFDLDRAGRNCYDGRVYNVVRIVEEQR